MMDSVDRHKHRHPQSNNEHEVHSGWEQTVLVTPLRGGKVRAMRAMVKRIVPTRKATCPRLAAERRAQDDRRGANPAQRRGGGMQGEGVGLCRLYSDSRIFFKIPAPYKVYQAGGEGTLSNSRHTGIEGESKRRVYFELINSESCFMG